MTGLVTTIGLLLLAAPAQPPGGGALRKLKPLQPRVAAKAKPVATRSAPTRTAPSPMKAPEHLEGWPLGWGVGTHRHWLEFARGRRLWRTGVGLLATGVSGLAVSLSLGITGLIATPFRGMIGGLMTGFGVVSAILTYVGASLLVKGRRIRDRAVLNILEVRSRTGTVSAGLRLGLANLQLGGRF